MCQARISTSVAQKERLESELQLQSQRSAELQRHIVKLEESLRAAVSRIYGPPHDGPVSSSLP